MSSEPTYLLREYALRTNSSPSTTLTSVPGIGGPQLIASAPSMTTGLMPTEWVTAKTFSAIPQEFEMFAGGVPVVSTNRFIVCHRVGSEHEIQRRMLGAALPRRAISSNAKFGM